MADATLIYRDCMPVINNTSKPESVLQKKYITAHYYTFFITVAEGEKFTAHIHGNENTADI